MRIVDLILGKHMNTTTIPAWNKFISAFIALILVVGNIFLVSPIWGFNYFVLNLPFGLVSEWYSNGIILLIGSFPLLSARYRYRTGYIPILICVISILVFKLFLLATALFVTGYESIEETTGSIFQHSFPRAVIIIGLIVYLVWTQLLTLLKKSTVLAVMFSICATAAIASYYVVDVYREFKSREITVNIKNNYDMHRCDWCSG